MIVYSLGFAAIFGIFTLLYLRVWLVWPEQFRDGYADASVESSSAATRELLQH